MELVGFIGLCALVIVPIVAYHQNRDSASSSKGGKRERVNDSGIGGSSLELFRRKVIDVGTYDGTESSRRKAQSAFDSMKQWIGCVNPMTEPLYWAVLREEHVPIPFAAVYAFTMGEFLQNLSIIGFVSGQMADARSKARDLELVFPEYASLVRRNLTSADSDTRDKSYCMIMGISSNLFDRFLLG